jgi:hypothetical protein
MVYIPLQTDAPNATIETLYKYQNKPDIPA